MQFSDVKAWLESLGVTPVLPGPDADFNVKDATPGPYVVATLGNGPGLQLDGLTDQRFLAVHVYGPPNDFAMAEYVAGQIDYALLTFPSGGLWGAARVIMVSRTGGSPALVEIDDGDRYHLSCTYVVEAELVAPRRP